MVLDCNETQEYLVLLNLPQFLFSLLYFCTLVISLAIILEVQPVFRCRLCKSFFFSLGVLLLFVVLHHREDYIMVLLCDWLVAKSYGLILLVPLSQDVFELTSHVVFDVLYLRPTPKICALIEDHTCLSASE